MGTAVVTGSGGLIGSAAVEYLVECGYDVVGIENDMRARFFGPSASTAPNTQRLLRAHPREFRVEPVDIRDAGAVHRVLARAGADVATVVHTAAQPSHDWA
jgi:CDP-paratose 2-epimerase